MGWSKFHIYTDYTSFNIAGGTIVKAIDLLKERGVGNKQIKVVSCYFGHARAHTHSIEVDLCHSIPN